MKHRCRHGDIDEDIIHKAWTLRVRIRAEAHMPCK